MTGWGRTLFESAKAAEAAFYRAFEIKDLEAMMGVWASDTTIVCIHPMGPRLTGYQDIRDSWAAVFQGDGPMQFAITDVEVFETDTLAVRVVYENIGFAGDQRSLVLATNVYRLREDGWRMSLHHGSPGRLVAAPMPSAQDGTLH